jgi:Adenylate and Guanylate cyclase catalytic domain
MKVSFSGDPRPGEQAPIVTFDWPKGVPTDSATPLDLEEEGSFAHSDDDDDFDDEQFSVHTETDNKKKNESNHLRSSSDHPLGSKGQLLREALVCLYCLQTVGTSVLVFFLAEDARGRDYYLVDDNNHNEEDQDDDHLFDGRFFYEIPPLAFTLVVAGIFSIIGGLAYAYHSILIRKLEKIDQSAQSTKEIVSSLFPAQFRKRLLEELVVGNLNEEATKTQDSSESSQAQGVGALRPNKAHIKGYLQQEKVEAGNTTFSRPIADLFPNCTVLFAGKDVDPAVYIRTSKKTRHSPHSILLRWADIAGFTAWSSEREPAQVFVLLESLFSTFDQIARRHKVFKVETIGDCYMAVTGLPEPQKDHAIRMVRFARQMMQQMLGVVKNLESSLGPDTGDLRLRIGIHSGPVTAGVLRGERARFQLFGDVSFLASK